MARDGLYKRQDADMSDEEKERAETPASETPEEVPSLLDEKRERERMSRMIAFGEGW